jgi:hypothetical protein
MPNLISVAAGVVHIIILLVKSLKQRCVVTSTYNYNSTENHHLTYAKSLKTSNFFVIHLSLTCLLV